VNLLKQYWEVPVFILFAAVCILFPQIDLWVSGLFYDNEQGFYLNDNPIVQVVYNVFRYMPAFLFPAILFMLVAPYFIKKKQGTRK
jgi:lipid A 4'-phosphatase